MDNSPPPVLPGTAASPPGAPPQGWTPPPVPPPPMMRPGTPARPTPPARGWKVMALILLALLLLSVAGNAWHAVRGWVGLGERTWHGAGPRLQEVVLEQHGAEDKIAVVDVEGVIYGGMLDGGEYSPASLVGRQLERAAKDEDVKAVVLRVNSPGGEVLAADEISRAIEEFQRRTGKPVVASMGSLAASGGYYVAAPCRWIVANELTITGSIGVIMHGYNYRGLMNKIGLRPEVYKTGKFKDMLSPDRSDEEIPTEERQMIQQLVDEAFARFKKVIADGRAKAGELNKAEGRKLAAGWEAWADGRVLTGRQARELGFVDELGDLKAAVQRAKTLAHMAQAANLIQYQQPFEWGSLFRMFGKTDVRTVKLDLGVDLPRLRLGQMYYLFLPAGR